MPQLRRETQAIGGAKFARTPESGPSHAATRADLTWYTVSFTAPKRTTAVQEEIQEAALKLPRVVIDPGFAIFVISRQGTQQWFFSPAVAPIAQMFGAAVCAKPDPTGWRRFALSIGDAGAWQLHFPAYDTRGF